VVLAARRSGNQTSASLHRQLQDGGNSYGRASPADRAQAAAVHVARLTGPADDGRVYWTSPLSFPREDGSNSAASSPLPRKSGLGGSGRSCEAGASGSMASGSGGFASEIGASMDSSSWWRTSSWWLPGTALSRLVPQPAAAMRAFGRQSAGASSGTRTITVQGGMRDQANSRACLSACSRVANMRTRSG
jgi:hypothetical protein